MKDYRRRIVDDELALRLEAFGAVQIKGPKWCGKTTTAMEHSKSYIKLQDPDRRAGYLATARTKPSLLLKGDTPRLIDEWQLALQLWDAIRFEADHRAELGQFILTGSAVPVNTKLISHSGTGRFAWITMRPMSLFESGDSTGEVSLASLFSNSKEIGGFSKITLSGLAFLICRGGWPQAVDLDEKFALRHAAAYYDALVSNDIRRADNVRKRTEKIRRFLRSYAMNQGRQVPNTVLAKGLSMNGKPQMSDETVASYLDALKKIFVIEEMTVWNPNLRSKAAIRTSNTRYFVDPSIAVAALGIGPNDLINDLKTFGFFLETLCVRDLRVYADSLNGQVYHYRDKDGQECDAVVHLRNGKYGLIEIKLGGDELIEEGAKTLKAMEEKIDTDKMGKPSFSIVLTGLGGYAYRRPDGICVVPIGCLKN